MGDKLLCINSAAPATNSAIREHPHNRKARLLCSGIGPLQFYSLYAIKNLSETLVRTAAITGWLRRLLCRGMCGKGHHVSYFLTDAKCCQELFSGRVYGTRIRVLSVRRINPSR